jgi:hypothetical protein
MSSLCALQFTSSALVCGSWPKSDRTVLVRTAGKRDPLAQVEIARENAPVAFVATMLAFALVLHKHCSFCEPSERGRLAAGRPEGGRRRAASILYQRSS